MHATQGGIKAHFLRRLIHVSIIFVPLLYYFIFMRYFSTSVLHRVLLGFILAILIFEWIRIKNRLIFFAQRYHEATHFSAFAWTVISISIICISQSTPTFALPIVASCALADPLMGEMRIRKIKSRWIIMAGLFVVSAIWLSAALYFHFPYWFVLLAPVTVLVEWPSFRWIDDNALMLLVPLLLVMCLRCLVQV
ncbi:MAG: hypothetical protein Q8L78_03025 [Coxiellaceae bacterium]|nr:hypothetical protein [Coxiellaceae bacterium]